ncbi:hypothetical protein MBANPS3_012435 [Mucor bainieri]
MSNNFQHLPTELLLTIFEYIDAKDMIEFQQVCKSWFYPAKIKLYSDLVVNTNPALGKAIFSLEINGHLVKHLSLNSIESSKNYAPGSELKTLLGYCSNVRSISSTGTTLDAIVLKALASLRDQPLSKLQKIPTAFPKCRQYTQCVYKYRKSLTEVCVDHDGIDHTLISDLKQFPELVSLNIRSPIRDLFRFDRLIASCPKLSCISLVLQPLKRAIWLVPLSSVSNNDSLQKLAFTATMNALFDFTHLYGLLRKFKALETLSLVVHSDFLPRSTTTHVLKYWAEIIKLANRLQDVEIKAYPLFASRFPPNVDTVNSRFVVDCVETVIKSAHQQHRKRQSGEFWSYTFTLIVCKELKSHENYIFYKIAAKMKRQELLVKIPLKVYRTDKLQELIKEMGPFVTSLCLDLPRNLPTAPTLDWIPLTLLPACKTVQRLTIMGGLFKNKIPSNCKARIAFSFPCLERLNLTFDMKDETLNNNSIRISMPKTRLHQIMIEPKNYGYRIPRKSAFIIDLKVSTHSTPLRYRYDHVLDQTVFLPAQDRPNTGQLNAVTTEFFKIKIELGDLQSFLFVFDGLTRVSWWK